MPRLAGGPPSLPSSLRAAVGNCRSPFVRSSIVKPLSTTSSLFTSRFSSSHSTLLRNARSISEFPCSRNLSSGSLPNHLKVMLPALSPTMEMGTVVGWHKKEGEQLSEGDLLCDIETDKATMGFDTPEEGYLAKILIAAGSKDVPIGKLLCIIVENESDLKAFADYEGDSFIAPSAAATTAQTAPSPAVPPSAPRGFENPSLMGPAVRLLLHHYGIKENDVQRSGPKHNILKEDVVAFISAKNLKPVAIRVSPPEVATKPSTAREPEKHVASVRHVERFVDIPLTNIRSVIAKRLSHSKRTIPHQYMSADVRAEKLSALRKQFKLQGSPVSVNDFIVKACALALKAVPEVNVQWSNDEPVVQKTVDISVAVATPSGLITPIVFGAEQLGIGEISDKIRELAKKAKENRLQPQEFQGGTFTISNLGMFGSVTNFTAIINPPQAAILAVGGPRDVLTEDLNTESRFEVTLCFDARAVSADSASRFLAHLTHSLSDPEVMLAQPIQEPFDFDYAKLL